MCLLELLCNINSSIVQISYDASDEFVNSLAIVWERVHGSDNATYFCQVASASDKMLEDHYTLSVRTHF